MDKKICSECGTENEQEYIYCKNCGALLGTAKTEPQKAPAVEFISDKKTEPEYRNTESETANPQGDQRQYYGTQYTPYSSSSYTIGGIPAEEAALFVGKKSAEIMPKFIRMEITRSKVSWCWPAAILGFFFGPMGAALWFLYRKMYKIGTVLLVAGAVLTCIFGAMNYGTDSQTVKNIIDSFAGSVVFLPELIDEAASETTVLGVIASALESITDLASGIIAGVLGFYVYKEHCVKSILNFRNSCPDSRYYKIGLASVGGVSGGMLAAGLVCIVVVNNAVSLVTALISMI
ncbi:MAG: zinc ribbon domain-containing protein [Acutalibacteraceae bacterium]|nr:zinc ribbon domain-containing protein [Acutalibacteraceae bacterium]